MVKTKIYILKWPIIQNYNIQRLPDYYYLPLVFTPIPSKMGLGTPLTLYRVYIAYYTRLRWPRHSIMLHRPKGLIKLNSDGLADNFDLCPPQCALIITIWHFTHDQLNYRFGPYTPYTVIIIIIIIYVSIICISCTVCNITW